VVGVGAGVGIGVAVGTGVVVGVAVGAGVVVSVGVGVALGDGGGDPVFWVQDVVGANGAPHVWPYGVQKPVW